MIIAFFVAIGVAIIGLTGLVLGFDRSLDDYERELSGESEDDK